MAAILFPVFAQARAKARQTTCLSNEKQIGTSFMMYAQDYDETLPANSNGGSIGGGEALGWMVPYNATRAATWQSIPRDIQPYMKNLAVFICPESPSRASAQPSPTFGDPIAKGTGGGNTNYLFNGIPMGRSLAAIPAPADIIFLHEERYHSRISQARPYLKATDNKWYGCDWSSYNNLHNSGQGANILYCDGHAKYSPKTQLKMSHLGCLATPDQVLGTGSTITRGNTGFPAAF